MEENLDNYLDQMESKFRKLQQAQEELKNFHDELDNYKPNEYFSYKNAIAEAVDDAGRLPDEIIHLGDNVDELELKKAGQMEKKKQKDKILSKLSNIQDDLNDLITRVKQKEKRFEGVTDDEHQFQRDRGDSFGGQMKLLTLEKNQEVLEKRRKDLEEIKQTSAQVNQLSQVMKQEVHQQGEMLNDIESNVTKAETNINKAQEQIKEAENLQRKGRSKAVWIAMIVLFVVIVVVVIIVCIFVGKKK